MNKIQIGNIFKMLRNNSGLTQIQMADKIGVGQKHYNQFENGIQDLTFDTFRKLLDFFNCKVDIITPPMQFRFPISEKNVQEIPEIRKYRKKIKA